MEKDSVLNTCYSILIKEYNIADYEKRQALDRILFDYSKQVSTYEFDNVLIELFRRTMKFFIDHYTKDVDFTNLLISKTVDFEKYITSGGTPHFYLWKDLIDYWEKCMLIEHTVNNSYKGQSHYYDSVEELNSLNLNLEGFDEMRVSVSVSKSGASRKKLLSLSYRDDIVIKNTKGELEVRSGNCKLGLINENQNIIQELMNGKRIQHIFVDKIVKTQKFAWDTATYNFLIKILFE